MIFGLEIPIENPYLKALAIIFVIFLVLRILVFIIEKVVLRLTLKTQTKADDVFVKKSSKPVSILVLLVGVRIALIDFPMDESISWAMNNIIYSLMIISISFIVYLFVDIVLYIALRNTMKGERASTRESLTSIVHGVMKVLLISFAILYILDIWGIEIGPFLAGLGIAGLAIAFAMQSSLNNIFGGISMILDKSIKVGDLVYLDDNTKGKIREVGLRSTKILTFDNEFIIIPNGKLADSKIQNVGKPDPTSRVVIPFGVAYGSDVEKVKKVVIAEIKKIKNFIKKPEPSIKFLEMGDSSLNFKAYFYVDSFENRFGAIDEANTRIYNALNKHNIEIPFPQMDVHMKKK